MKEKNILMSRPEGYADTDGPPASLQRLLQGFLDNGPRVSDPTPLAFGNSRYGRQSRGWNSQGFSRHRSNPRSFHRYRETQVVPCSRRGSNHKCLDSLREV